jgi:hypothetical protein
MIRYDRQMNMIADILNEFNFERVHQTMVCLGWKWHSIGVPDIDTIRNSARERIDNAIKGCLKDAHTGQEYIAASGGLKATVTKNHYGQIDFIELEFILTNWETTN